MSQDNPQSAKLAGNPLDLTDAEKDALKGFDEDGNEVAPPTPAAVEPPKPEAAAQEPPAPAVDAVPVTTPPTPAPEIAPAPASAPAAAAPTPAALPELRNEARDYKAELAALKEQLQKGTIDDDTYEERRDEIVSDRTAAKVRDELSNDFAEHSWQQNVATFLAQPENSALLRSAEIQAVWTQTMQTAVNNAAAQGHALTNDFEIMKAGRDLLFQQLGLSSPVAAPPAPEPPPKPNQAPPMAQVPPTLNGIPAAAPTGARHTAESIAALDINEAEKIMAGMSEAQQDELLRGVPGAFVD